MDMSELKVLLKEQSDEVKSLAQKQGEAIKETMGAHQARLEKLEKGESLADITAKLKELADAQTKTSEAFDKAFLQVKRLTELPEQTKSTGELFAEYAGFKAVQESKASRSGKMEVKAITRATASMTNDNPMVAVQRAAGIQQEPNAVMLVRQLMTTGQTTNNLIEYVREDVFTNGAAMVAEGALKPETNITFVKADTKVKTIAHWTQASRQVLDDISMLRSYIDGRMVYGLDIREDAQLLSGDGTGENLLGIIPQATAFSEALMTGVQTPQIIDRIMMAFVQCYQANYAPTGIVMNTLDWAKLMLAKTTEGAYLYANPGNAPTPRLWGLNVVASNEMPVGKFLVGAFAQAGMIWDRQQTTIEASTEDRDNFVKNMVTILAEKRIALEVTRPKSFVYGNTVPV